MNHSNARSTVRRPVPANRAARELRLTPLMLSLVCLGVTPAIAQTLPAGFSAVAGNVAVRPGSPTGTMNIDQGSERAIAQWLSFSIGAGGTVNVAQPSRSSVLLNRVVGNDLSTIAGSLNANGSVYLINPNGVLFSKGSSISVGGLVASTLDISNQSFMAGGKQLVFERNDANAATVTNQGSIATNAPGGIVALMGAQVINEGSINVARGSVGLVSARKVTVDFDGDGLTRFTIPADSKATAALVENAAAGSVTADGGRIAMLAAAEAKAQVVNQSGVLRARSLESVNGQIVLGAGSGTGADNLNGMRVGGTLDVSGGATGNGGTVQVSAGNLLVNGATIDASGLSGGQVTTSAHRMVVDAGTNVGASGSGQAGTTDGRWTIASGQDITVSNNPPYDPNATGPTAPMDGGSTINAGVLSRTLNRSTSLTLESAATPTDFDDINGYSFGFGVLFDQGAQVLKTEGRGAGFTVNSARNIGMGPDTALASSSGALNVDFNADAKGDPLPAVLPIALNGNGRLGGSIGLNQARIESNGGDIRFYGQGDPVNGRAVGGVQRDGIFVPPGIQMANSLVSTCAAGAAACSTGGAISMRGQGGTGSQEGSQVQGGVGVAVYGTTLRTGSGGITLDGRGGLGASGVRSVEFGQAGERSAIESASGDIRITGDTRGWTASDPVVVFRSDDGDGSNDFFGGGGGVTLLNTRVSTGGGVVLDGTGADLTALAGNANFQGLLMGAASGNSASAGASHGVLINSTDITAGAGRSISLSGRAGGNGFTVSILPSEQTVVALDTALASGVTVSSSFGQGALQAEGGRISIQGREGSDVYLSYDDDSEGGPLTLLNVASASRAGGSIDIAGRNILIANTFVEPTANFLDASGAGQGGSISVRGSGAIAIDGNAGMAVDAASASGNGGSIHVVAGTDLRSYGSYSARGGAQGGNGGFVETSGRNVDLSGIRVDASAPAGKAGTWLVDPFDITIQDGAVSGSLPTLPFVALANSIIQDGDINAALNGGTSVAIGTGTIDPTSFLGTITINSGVDINVDTGSKAVSFQLDASRNINAFGGVQIRASSAPLDVVFNAGQSGQSGAINYNGDILTNGGSVTMTALGNSGSCAICMNGTLIDTRVGGVDTNPGGNVTLTVPAPGTNPGAGNFSTAAVNLSSTDISTSTGNVDITGFSQNGTGVRLDGTLFIGEGRLGVISTTSGNIDITGVGAFASNSADAPGHGVIIDNARLSSVDGSIAVRGLRQAGTTPGNGVLLQNGAQVLATGAGDIEVTGESLGAAAGLVLTAGSTTPQGVTFPDAVINGNRNVVLRASNDGSTDAIVIGGTVNAGQVLNLRPGGVDAATGAGVDRTAAPITLLGAGASGFAISAQEMTRLTAATVVAGSNAHAGNIDVLAPMTSSVPLTLQNGGGGNINLAAPISAPQLGLISGGNITQAPGATITAGTLLARSTGGNVILGDPGNNVSSTTLGGGAAGRFEFVNSGPLRVGPVSVTGFDAAGNLPQVQAASSMAADTVLIRTLAGSLILDTNVSSTNGADLVAATTFQNAGGGSLSGAPWRVWADTWVGEARGGLVGSGQLPNLYHCAYLGTCTVTVSPGDNHFIYAQQPSVTVNIGSFARNVGQSNPAFTYTLSGLILGDTGAGISGTTSTTAGLQSPAGAYPVSGTFTSAEGYAITVVPGTLVVGNVLPKPAQFVDVLREEPTTYIYDRNLGQAPICLATGPLEGDRAQQGNDVLAREWSRVRTRPNLTSCVDTERGNGCADF